MKVIVQIEVKLENLIWWILISLVTMRFDLIIELIKRYKYLLDIKKKLKIPYLVTIKWKR
jgi:hypothetical protein